MKIKPLQKDSAGRYDLYEVPEKINEIINMLNRSFLTQEHDEAIFDITSSLTNISCDRLTPLTNETTCELTAEHVLNMIEGDALYAGVKCPECGAKYFTVGSSVCTFVNYPPVIKDGVNINPDRNECTTSYECLECGHKWSE